jgi:hypothetical protein
MKKLKLNARAKIDASPGRKSISQKMPITIRNADGSIRIVSIRKTAAAPRPVVKPPPSPPTTRGCYKVERYDNMGILIGKEHMRRVYAGEPTLSSDEMINLIMRCSANAMLSYDAASAL